MCNFVWKQMVTRLVVEIISVSTHIASLCYAPETNIKVYVNYSLIKQTVSGVF